MNDGFEKDLGRVAAARIFFVHMSVGGNVLSGLERVAHGEIAIVARDEASTAPLAAHTLTHQLFGQNGDPDAKFRAFEQLVLAQPEPGPDVALMKLCYDDVQPGTDADALFARYAATVERIHSARPALKIVHVTTPLTTRDPLAKEIVKRLTGLSDNTAGANIRRELYNARLRAAYPKDAIFDLAALESRGPDGREAGFVRNGTWYRSLAPELSNDGHHLAGVGQELAARELVRVLARTLGE